MYCAHCGNELPAAESQAEHDQAAEDVAEAVASADVEIERIRADKEIKIAKITAGVIDQERDEELARAEGVAEGLHEAIAPELPEQPSETPVVVVNDDSAPEEPEVSPPPAEESSEPSRHEPEHSGYGNSAWFAA